MNIPETLERPYGTTPLLRAHFTSALCENPTGDRELVVHQYPQDDETPEGDL